MIKFIKECIDDILEFIWIIKRRREFRRRVLAYRKNANGKRKINRTPFALPTSRNGHKPPLK